MAAAITLSPEERAERARRAAIIRWDPEARQDHHYELIAAAIERAVSAAPPLSAERRGKLALLLHPGGATAAS